MITINSPSVVINVSPIFNESSPGTLARLAQLEQSMSAEVDKVDELGGKVEELLTLVEGLSTELADLKVVADANPEVISRVQAIEDRIAAVVEKLKQPPPTPTPTPTPEPVPTPEPTPAPPVV